MIKSIFKSLLSAIIFYAKTAVISLPIWFITLYINQYIHDYVIVTLVAWASACLVIFILFALDMKYDYFNKEPTKCK